jgi:hypothetical protein
MATKIFFPAGLYPAVMAQLIVGGIIAGVAGTQNHRNYPYDKENK